MAEKVFKYIETTHVREGRLLISSVIEVDSTRKKVRISKIKV
jgi:translation initiation factor 2 alpha subunit (eIF-2alpha)